MCVAAAASASGNQSRNGLINGVALKHGSKISATSSAKAISGHQRRAGIEETISAAAWRMAAPLRLMAYIAAAKAAWHRKTSKYRNVNSQRIVAYDVAKRKKAARQKSKGISEKKKSESVNGVNVASRRHPAQCRKRSASRNNQKSEAAWRNK